MDSVNPGEFLKALLKRRNMPVIELARRCGVPDHRIRSIIYRGVPITAELWLKFELVTGIPAERWREMNTEFQLQRVRERHAKRNSRVTGADGGV